MESGAAVAVTIFVTLLIVGGVWLLVQKAADRCLRRFRKARGRFDWKHRFPTRTALYRQKFHLKVAVVDKMLPDNSVQWWHDMQWIQELRLYLDEAIRYRHTLDESDDLSEIMHLMWSIRRLEMFFRKLHMPAACEVATMMDSTIRVIKHTEYMLVRRFKRFVHRTCCCNPWYDYERLRQFDSNDEGISLPDTRHGRPNGRVPDDESDDDGYELKL